MSSLFETGGMGRELRQIAGEVETRAASAEPFDEYRLTCIAKAILLAAQMADNFDGLYDVAKEMKPEIADAIFDDILYREYPDGAPETPPENEAD